MLVVIIEADAGAGAAGAARRKFGTRLMTKLAVFFGVVGVLPGVLIYLVSPQFVSRIESRGSMKVESALEAGLNLGRTTMDASLADLQNKGRLIAEQLGDGSARPRPSTSTGCVSNSACRRPPSLPATAAWRPPRRARMTRWCRTSLGRPCWSRRARLAATPACRQRQRDRR